MMAAAAHGPPVDVWGLGQVLSKLLGCTQATDDHPLSQLVIDMVRDDPDQRPTMESVCERLGTI